MSISRLIPKFYWTHKASIVVACLSVFIGLGILIQTCIFCAKIDKTWTHVPPYRCTVTSVSGIIRLGCEFIHFFFLLVGPRCFCQLDHVFSFFWRLSEISIKENTDFDYFFLELAEVVVDIFLVLIPFCAFFLPIPSFSFGPSPASNQPSPTASDLPNNNNINLPQPARPRLGLPPVTRRLIQACFLASLLTTSTAIAFVTILFKIQHSSSQEIQARIGYMAFVLSHLTVSSPLLKIYNSKCLANLQPSLLNN